MKKLISFLILFSLVGCQSFDSKFWMLHSLSPSENGFFEVKRRKMRKDILKTLGEPLQKGLHKLPEEPFMGPQEGLQSVIREGTTYEEWIYKNKGYDYYVWFSVEKELKSQRFVIAVARYPTGAVF